MHVIRHLSDCVTMVASTAVNNAFIDAVIVWKCGHISPAREVN